MAYCNSKSLYKDMSCTKDSSTCGYYTDVDISFDKTDYYLQVDKEYEHCPGKLAKKLYGSEKFMWVFSYFNRSLVNDPIFDLNAGIVIRVPTVERLSKYF